MACPCFLHRVFSKAVQPSIKVVVEVYINDFFLAVESMKMEQEFGKELADRLLQEAQSHISRGLMKIKNITVVLWAV